MSFWASYRTSATQHRFEGHALTPIRAIESTGAITIAIERYRPEIRQFLADHFGTQSCPPPFSPEDLFVVAVEKGRIQGVGHTGLVQPLLEGHPIQVTDWFCVTPTHRGTGLATRLLTAGYSYLRSQGIHHCIYLKEGRPMRIATSPLYSSSYVYRSVRPGPSPSQSAPLTAQKAARLMGLLRDVRPNTFVLHSEALPNQTWRFWKKGLSWILMGFQDAYQQFQSASVGTLSAFFAGGGVGAAEVEAVIDSAPFGWIWADTAFIKDRRLWSIDGPFHWYTYQWSTCVVPSEQYCLMT